ncbi:MAG: VWA domain-containing protein [Pirellulales bacterium]
MPPGKWLAGLGVACVGWAVGSAALAAEVPGSAGVARFERYAKPDGRSYFALSLTAPAGEAAGPVDVVALVDTSASQVGPFREKSLQALQALLTSLRAEDRVQVIAVDADVVPLTKGFVAPGGDEAQAAVAALEARVPLGSTDMPAALRAAAATFEENHPTRAIAYIGDGMSAANVLQSAGFAQLAADLVGARAPVSCYAVGPRIDGMLLAALGNHTEAAC